MIKRILYIILTAIVVLTSCVKEVAVGVTNVTLNSQSANLFVGEKLKLSAEVSPNNASNPLVLWSSSNSSVATVDPDGLVVALAAGTVRITAKTDDKGLTDVCTITVSDVFIPVNSIAIDKDELELYEFESDTLSVRIFPEDATNKNLLWESSDNAVAKVVNGVVVAGKAGEAEVKVTTEDGGLSLKCLVQVKCKVSGININYPSLEIYETQSFQLNATVFPMRAEASKVDWSSSDESVATVDSYGEVKAIKAGTVNITASIRGTSLSDVCEVTVKGNSITLDQNKLILLEGQSDVKLTATITPPREDYPSIDWESTNDDVVTVRNDGSLIARTAGEAEVTATIRGTEYSAKCSVTVISRVSGITLSKDKLNLYVGEFETISATIAPDNASCPGVKWSSTNSNVANVVDGKITGVKVGTTIICATTEDGGFHSQCAVSVYNHVSGVELDHSSEKLDEGQTLQLVARVIPEDVLDKSLSWSSSDDRIASVDVNGKVTAKSKGTVDITVETTDGKKQASCRIQVVRRVQSVSLDQTSVSVYETESFKLNPIITPSDADNLNVSWFSSNASVAEVDNQGNVTPKTAGTANITVTTEDGVKTATCQVKVLCHVTGVTLDKTTLEFNIGGSPVQLVATVSPERASDKEVTWASGDNSVATVSTNGLVTPIAKGQTTVTVTTKDGGKTASCAVVVKEQIKVSSISLDSQQINLEIGKTRKLVATILPENATNKALEWSSSDTGKVTVDQEGNLTAVAQGSATVTAKATDGSGKSASCLVTVVPSKVYVTSVTFTSASVTMSVGDTKTLSATVLPTNATDKTLKWSSSDTGKVTVDENGKLTAIAQGSATVTAKANDGSGKSASCVITVLSSMVHVTSVTVAPTSLSMNIGNSQQLSATVLPTNATDKTVSWSSSNPAVAQVSTYGMVTAMSKGSATITATSTDGDKKGVCSVTVTGVQPTGVYFEKTSMTLTVNDIVEVKAYPYVLVGGQKVIVDDDLTYTVPTGGSVLITNKGDNTVIVRAQKPGIPKLTAKTSNGYSATCSITVLPIVLQSLSFVPDAVSLKVGEKMTLEPRIEPWNATSSSTRWVSSNSKIVSVNSSGEITALAEGEVVITFYFNRADPSNPIKSLSDSAKCTVRVKPANVDEGGAEGVTFDELN